MLLTRAVMIIEFQYKKKIIHDNNITDIYRIKFYLLNSFLTLLICCFLFLGQ